MICPKCKAEYEEGCTVCADCNIDLVDNVSIENTVEIRKFDAYENAELEFVVTAGDKIEANMMESLLISLDIPVLKKYKEAGTYITVFAGDSCYGIDLYVPAERAEEAHKIIDNYFRSNETLRDDEGIVENVAESQLEEDEENKIIQWLKRWLIWIVVFILIGGPAFIYFLIWLGHRFL